METTTFKLTLELQSPFVTPMQSDTLFGQLIWMVRHSSGESAAAKFIGEVVNGGGILSVSAGLPHDKIPLPFIPASDDKTANLLRVFQEARSKVPGSRRAEYYSVRYLKAVKKSFGYADAALFYSGSGLKCLGDITSGGIVPDMESAVSFVKKPVSSFLPADAAVMKKATVTRNVINRLTGCTGEGSLFETENEFYKPGSLKDVYIRTNLLLESDLAGYFKAMGIYGFGADATTGKGRFKVSGIEKCTFENQEGAEYVLTLGSCIPAKDEAELEASYYSVFVKRGKMGGEHAGGVPEKTGSFFKVPLLMLKEGALLKVKEKKQVYGKLEQNVNAHIPEAVQSGQCFGPLVKL